MRLESSANLKKIISLYGANIFGITLGFLISIFNSRVLGPEDFGTYKFIETVGRFIASLVSVGLFISITRLVASNNRADVEHKYVGLFTYLFGITSGLGIILYLIFSLVEPYIFDNNITSSITRFFFIVAAIIGQTAISDLLKGLHRIYTLSIFSIIPMLAYLICIWWINQFIPIDIDIVLYCYYLLILLSILAIILILKPSFSIGKDLIKKLVKENKFNGRPIYFGSLAGVATTHIAGLSIAYFLNNSQVGFFMLALTICSPLLVIPSVIGTIYFKQFVDMRAIPKKVFLFSLASTLLALVIFYLLIDYMIITFYTKSYLPVSSISKYLIIAFIFHGLGDLFNRFLGAKGEGKKLRNAAFIVGFVNIAGYTLLIKYFDMNGAILTKVIASALYLIVMYRYYINFIKNKKNV
ncbi:lipopolysaccharide biosynthesis protein [Zeaxanthinibacter enoshimensis]|uniref:O-antigen/teichoic acid export membrane protein n=1 Tax=Zeaxanthinibacter enoshimensis TaxID=392009 RepID=A0A4R6TRQ5_9FLAO|nr:oligosaccharide flippase family protein [Zeaxanthinibacter enoshimensis]TDQ31170.1 O-antigen/teichoic acid export membrane protein [Zeaxanthinibacter enoshimensis]